jgi:hypothetical protein
MSFATAFTITGASSALTWCREEASDLLARDAASEPKRNHGQVGRISQQLSTHQVVTVVLPTVDEKISKICKATTPEPVTECV